MSSVMSNAAKSFDILVTSLRVLHNYFDGTTKLLSELYLDWIFQQNHIFQIEFTF